jgi:hypothetical protein
MNGCWCYMPLSCSTCVLFSPFILLSYFLAEVRIPSQQAFLENWKHVEGKLSQKLSVSVSMTPLVRCLNAPSIIKGFENAKLGEILYNFSTARLRWHSYITQIEGKIHFFWLLCRYNFSSLNLACKIILKTVIFTYFIHHNSKIQFFGVKST